MNNVERRVREASVLLEPNVSPSDTERALRRFKDLGRQRRQRAIVSGVLVGSCVTAASVFFALQPPPVPTDSAPVIATAPQAPKNRVHFADGSFAELVDPKTNIKVEYSVAELLELRLTSGSARFEVAKNPQRLFRVRTRSLRIEVLGTEFTVSDRPGDESVVVHSGRVAVYSGGSRHELEAGMSFSYDASSEELAEDTKQPAKKKRAKVRVKKSAQSSKWKQLAKDGRYSAAYEAMMEDPAETEPAGVEELMLAADVARLTGHPKEAASYLTTVIEEHRRDSNAVLAAFTLGRIYEKDLREPVKCAEAFHTARALSPAGSLAEDALAHEAECRASAGQHEAAKALAKEYVERHSDGRKIERMRRVSGIER